MEEETLIKRDIFGEKIRKKNHLKNEQGFKDLKDTNKHSSMHIMGNFMKTKRKDRKYI